VRGLSEEVIGGKVTVLADKRSDSKPTLHRRVKHAALSAMALTGLGYGLGSIGGPEMPFLSIVSLLGWVGGVQFLVGVVLPVWLAARRGDPDRPLPIRLLVTNLYFLALASGVLLGLR
jgi:hypothetical protein